MKRSILYLNDIDLPPSQIHKLRGYIGNFFSQHDLLHNHDLKTGKPIYRYPLIQFKLIEKTPAILAVTGRAVGIFREIFMRLEQIVIDCRTIPVIEKNLKIDDVDFGYSEEMFLYEFISPWIGLNQKNWRKFEAAEKDSERKEILKRALIGNILSMSKSLDVWLSKDQRIKAEILVENNLVELKGETMSGFTGIFKTNFMIPDNLGIGKSVSRGFGTVRRVI